MPVIRGFNTLLAFQFIRELTKDWTEMDAYDLGIIDENGNILKKMADLKTREEKNNYTFFHRIVWNLKKMLEGLPGGKSKIKSYAAALWLLKENKETIQDEIKHLVEIEDRTKAKDFINELYGEISSEIKDLNEEPAAAPPTNVSSGVAKKDMPLRKRKRKKDDDEEEECDDYTCNSDKDVLSLKRKIKKANTTK